MVAKVLYGEFSNSLSLSSRRFGKYLSSKVDVRVYNGLKPKNGTDVSDPLSKVDNDSDEEALPTSIINLKNKQKARRIQNRKNFGSLVSLIIRKKQTPKNSTVSNRCSKMTFGSKMSQIFWEILHLRRALIEFT